MKLINYFLFFIFYFSLTSCANAAQMETVKYTKYQSELKRCIVKEKKKEPLTFSDINNLSLSVIKKGFFYLKEKRLVDCSSKSELLALSEELMNKPNMDNLSVRYLSVWLVELESQFSQLTMEERQKLINITNDKSLEINFINLIEKFGGN